MSTLQVRRSKCTLTITIYICRKRTKTLQHDITERHDINPDKKMIAVFLFIEHYFCLYIHLFVLC